MSDGLLASAVADPISFCAKLMVVVGVVGLLCQFISFRCRKSIADWASRGGWSVVSARRCWLGAPAFSFVPGTPVYRVTLESRSGRTRTAYFRCGNATLSVLSDELAVEWVG